MVGSVKLAVVMVPAETVMLALPFKAIISSEAVNGLTQNTTVRTFDIVLPTVMVSFVPSNSRQYSLTQLALLIQLGAAVLAPNAPSLPLPLLSQTSLEPPGQVLFEPSSKGQWATGETL